MCTGHVKYSLSSQEMRANAWLQHMKAELQKLQNLNRELTTQSQHLTVVNNSLLHERQQLISENQGGPLCAEDFFLVVGCVLRA